MKRWIWLAGAAVVVIALGATLVALPKGQEWTTDSPEALAAFEAGMDAQMRIYYDDAQRHFRRAIELDPDFVIAKFYAIDGFRSEGEDKVKAMWDSVVSADLEQLTAREKLIIERARARREKRPKDAERLLEEALADHPNDPFIVNLNALQTWQRGEFEDAERLYQRLVEIHPNWVIAYNQLGYINMGLGRFAEAEEYFKSYRFIAPDQANPFDSLGELYITLGRYAEAEETLNRALEIKSDFWAAYEHLALMTSFSGDLEATRRVIDRAKAAGMHESQVDNLMCLEQYTAWRNAEAWTEILEASEGECAYGKNINFAKVTTHLAACSVGDWETATSIEEEASEVLAKVEERGPSRELRVVRGALQHLIGVRLAFEGEYAEAADNLRAANENLTYIEAGTALYKLYNNMALAELLLADGQDAEAHGLLSKMRSVNPLVVAEFEDSGLTVIGLERG